MSASSLPSAPVLLVASPESNPDERFEAVLKLHVNELMRLLAAVADVAPEDPAAVGGGGNAPRQSDAVVSQLESLQTTLAELDALKDSLTLSIPLSLIEHVDQGLNPDTVLRGWTQTLAEKNQRIAGQTVALRAWEAQVGQALDASASSSLSDPPLMAIAANSISSPVTSELNSLRQEGPAATS
ncbi:hypothetical protein BDZ88DRAFT_455008 [Geranomyces variabilis]|nr:hypothetical protein BDZ88DRAFT_455008 [Geranomyces variabilis]KAJ3136497.1 hypothetical protein HDU90_003210 [Geranomyces variabilis]